MDNDSDVKGVETNASSVVHGNSNKHPGKQVQPARTPSRRVKDNIEVAKTRMLSASYEDHSGRASKRVNQGGKKTKLRVVDDDDDDDDIEHTANGAQSHPPATRANLYYSSIRGPGGSVSNEANAGSGLAPYWSLPSQEEGTSQLPALSSSGSTDTNPDVPVWMKKSGSSLNPHRPYSLVENPWTQAGLFSEQILEGRPWSTDLAPSRTQLPLRHRRASSIRKIAPPDGVRLPPITGGDDMGAFSSSFYVNLPPLRDFIQGIPSGPERSSFRIKF
jgi:hypothetical protein